MAGKSTSKDQFSVTTYTKGFKELSDMLRSFIDPVFRKRALLEAGRKTMLPLVQKFRSAAPEIKGEMAKKNPNTPAGILKNSIKYTASYNQGVKYNRHGKYVSLSKYEYAGQIRTGQKSEQFAKVMEYGRPAFKATRDVVFGNVVYPYDVIIPAVKPTAFMRKTLDANYYRMIITFKNELKKSIDKRKLQEIRKIKASTRKLIKKEKMLSNINQL